jgi:hypothetical protein
VALNGIPEKLVGPGGRYPTIEEFRRFRGELDQHQERLPPEVEREIRALVEGELPFMRESLAKDLLEREGVVDPLRLELLVRNTEEVCLFLCEQEMRKLLGMEHLC